jgi:hypothetical protein
VTRDYDWRVMVNNEERTVILAAAERAGTTPSRFLRLAGLRAARRTLAGLEEDAPDLAPLPVDRAVEEARRTGARIDAELARVPRLSDPAIAEALGLTVDVVRRHRESRGIAGAPPARGDWEPRIREAHGRGLTVDEIATATGYTPGTVRTRLSQLGLRAAASGARRGRPPAG